MQPASGHDFSLLCMELYRACCVFFLLIASFFSFLRQKFSCEDLYFGRSYVQNSLLTKGFKAKNFSLLCYLWCYSLKSISHSGYVYESHAQSLYWLAHPDCSLAELDICFVFNRKTKHDQRSQCFSLFHLAAFQLAIFGLKTRFSIGRNLTAIVSFRW